VFMPLLWKETYHVEVYECDVCGHEEEYSFDPDDMSWGDSGSSMPTNCPNCAEKEAKISHRETNSSSS